jgi:hypothetical protein
MSGMLLFLEYALAQELSNSNTFVSITVLKGVRKLQHKTSMLLKINM